MTRQDVLQGFAQIAQPMEPIRDLHRAPWRAASGVGPGTITADHFRLDIAQTLAICRSSRFDIAQLHAICRSWPTGEALTLNKVTWQAYCDSSGDRP